MSKREQYNDAILRLLSDYDLKELTMDQIAEELGVTKRTLYNYYDDKESMFKEVIRKNAEQSMEHIRSIAADPHLDSIAKQSAMLTFALVHKNSQNPRFLKSVFEYYPDIHALISEQSRSFTTDFFVANVRQGRLEGLYHDDFNPQHLSSVLLFAMSHYIDNLMQGKPVTQHRAVWREVITCMLRGMVTPAGREILENELKKLPKK